MEKFYAQIYSVSAKITILIFAIVVVYGFTNKKRFQISMNLFFFYLLAILIYNLFEQSLIYAVNNYPEWWVPWLNKFKITDTNFMALYGRLIDIAFLLPFYILILELKPSKAWKIAYWILFFVSILIAIFIDGWRNYGTINSIINRSLLIVLPLAYFWKLYHQVSYLNLWKNPYFLISLGILIPNLLSFVMSIVGDKLAATDYVLFIKVSLFRNFVSLIGQVLFIRAFMYSKYTKFL